MSPTVRLIAWTHFEAPPDVSWDTDADGGQALAEFAGRACYESWHKPNPKTATNAGYLRHILEVGHLSVMEHATATFYITAAPRSLTHELIRHRHFSYSELSPRRLPAADDSAVNMVAPPAIADDPELLRLFAEATQASLAAYQALVRKLSEHDELGEHDKHDDAPAAGQPAARALRVQAARQAARAVLPNAIESRIVVTGNYRAWRHFIAARASEHIDVEIRALAVECLRQLRRLAPNAFGDFAIAALADGTPVAASPLVPEI